MSAVLHKDLSPSERHPIHSYEFADSAARLANNEYATTDVFRIAVQLDNNTVWMLTGITNPGAGATPAWTQVGSASATVDANSTIAGNPPALDTLAKVATAVQALQAFQSANDSNANLIVDTTDDMNTASDYVSLFQTGLL
jgi:hypothetical protein